MWIRCIFLLLLLLSFRETHAQVATTDTIYVSLDTVHLDSTSVQDTVLLTMQVDVVSTKRERKRLTAAILCLTLGPFGAHRLYLGTSTAVPVAYTLTLGGGLGVLPVIDLLLICFSSDITPYMNNPHVFMWNTAKE
jgi:TM2 domain-containing membrane protein YozV